MSSAAGADFRIETARLRLRPIEPADEALYVALYTSAAVMRHVGPALSRSRSARSFRAALAASTEPWRSGLMLRIERLVDGQAVGLCGMPAWQAAEARAEVGTMLLPDAGDRGYAREGFGAFIDRVFAVLPVAEVWVQYPTAHLRVERMMTALGFAPDPHPASVGAGKGLSIWTVHRDRWQIHYRRPGDDRDERH